MYFSRCFAQAGPAPGVIKSTVISCDGQGICRTCVTNNYNNTTSCWDNIKAYDSSDPQGSLITPCGCPVAFDPAIPYSWNPATGACDTPRFFITLTGGNEVEPSNGSIINTLPFIATVIDQNTKQPPTTPVTVKISLKVDDPKSGGHDHGDSTRPRGSIAEKASCDPYGDGECWSHATDGSGAVVFNFNPTEVSGTHTITATCDGCSNTATKTVDVKVDGLIPILGSVYYALTEDGSTKVIGDNGNHSGNHYLSSAASMKLWRVARDFYEYQIQKGAAIPTLLHLNDASLKWGGKFDVVGKWTGYHYKHDRGNAIDVRANTTAGYIPEAYFTDFENMAAGLGADAQLHCSATSDPSIDNCAGDENRHYHVILK